MRDLRDYAMRHKAKAFGRMLYLFRLRRRTTDVVAKRRITLEISQISGRLGVPYQPDLIDE